MLAAALAFAIAAVVAGCRDSDEQVVPWQPLPIELGPPPSFAVPDAPPGAPPCRPPAARLRISPAPGLPGDPYYVTVRNMGSRTCALDPYPTLSLGASGGIATGVHVQHYWEYESRRLPARTFGLRPGRTSWAMFSVANFCWAHQHARGVVWRIGLPTERPSARLRLSVCGPSLGVTIAPFYPPARPEPPPTRFPLRAEIIGEPRARRGTTLEYRVRLVNETDQPFEFPWCPLYVQAIVGRGDRSYGLNCAGVTIPPDAGVVFAMEYPLSPYFRPGVYFLEWRLENENLDVQATTRASLQIDA